MAVSFAEAKEISTEDVEEHETVFPEEILEIPANLNWIFSLKGQKYYRQVLERIVASSSCLTVAGTVELTSESTIAKTLLNASEENVVIDFLKEVSTCFLGCYENVQHIKCAKKRMITLERNFTCLPNNLLLKEKWSSLLGSCSVETTHNYATHILNHILQHFWSCLVLYESKDLSEANEADKLLDSTPTCSYSSTTTAQNIEVQAIKEHAGWVFKRVRDTFKEGAETCRIQVSKTDSTSVEVGKQYLLDLMKRLGQDILVQPGKFLFIPIAETIEFFIYLHTAVENIVKVQLERQGDKAIVKCCLQILSQNVELRELWYKVFGEGSGELFEAGRVLILQRIVTMFVKSKQQIIREQLQLKAQKQSSSLRQSLRKVKAKSNKSQPAEKKESNNDCINDFRQNSDNPANVAMILTNIFTNPTEAPDILKKFHGDELTKMLKSLGLPGLNGKRKQLQIEMLLKHNTDGKGWNITYPEKLKEDA